jgi:putative transposase
MPNFSFRAGTKIFIEKNEYLLIRKVNDNLWQAEEKNTNRIKEINDEDLKNLYLTGKLNFSEYQLKGSNKLSTSLVLNHDLSSEEWEILKMKLAYVKAIQYLNNTESATTPAIKEVWEKLGMPVSPPSWISVYRWKKRYLQAGQDIRALANNKKKSGNRTARYPDEIITIMEEGIDNYYLKPEKRSVNDTYELIKALVNRENDLRPPSMQLPLPGLRLLRRMIHSISAYDLYAAREGKESANNKFRGVHSHRITKGPLERAEIDHTRLDLMLLDDSGLPVGRPWLTTCIDDYSRCILGIVIGFEPPSFHTVAQCLKSAILPKTYLKEKYPTVKNDWPAFGIMRELVVDNGQEFHSTSLENACLSLGIEIHYAPRKNGAFKGKIERFQKTLNNDLAHPNPGTTFGNILDRGEYDPEKHAVISLKIFNTILHKWIADVYHQKPHRTLNTSPYLFWKGSIDISEIGLPQDMSELDIILGRSEMRTLTHKGIELNGLSYNSNELTALRKRLGEKLVVDIRFDDFDLGSIIVFSPNKDEKFRVPALLKEYAVGLSSYQHRICKKYASGKFGRTDERAYLEAKLELIELIAGLGEKGTRKKLVNTAKKSARFRGYEELTGSKKLISTDQSSGNSTQASMFLESDGGFNKIMNKDDEDKSMSNRGKPKFQFVVRNRNPKLIQNENFQEHNDE